MVEAARESIQVFHIAFQGALDFAITLNCNYNREGDQWVGICDELGTSAFSDTLEKTRSELQQAIQLQLNEVERITDIRDYLADNEVAIQPVSQLRQGGFAVAIGSNLEYLGA